MKAGHFPVSPVRCAAAPPVARAVAGRLSGRAASRIQPELRAVRYAAVAAPLPVTAAAGSTNVLSLPVAAASLRQLPVRLGEVWITHASSLIGVSSHGRATVPGGWASSRHVEPTPIRTACVAAENSRLAW
jgi:hypothetical protein